MKNIIKIISFMGVIASCLFCFDVYAKENTSFTYSKALNIYSMEKLKEKDSDLYSQYLNYKTIVFNRCTYEFGEDNYYYLIEKQANNSNEFNFVQGGTVSDQKYFKSFCYKKDSNKIKSNISMAYWYGSYNTYSYLYNSDTDNALVNSSNSDYFSKENNLFSAFIFNMETPVDKNDYIDTNMDIVFKNSNPNVTSENTNQYIIESLTINNITLKNGTYLLKNGVLYNPEVPPSNSNKDSIGWGSDFYKYEYFSIDPSKVFDDVYFELDDGANIKIDKIKYKYIEKDKPDSEVKIGYIEAKNDKFSKRFTKDFFSNLRHFSIEIYYPYLTQNYNYFGFWYNSYYKDSNNETISIFNSHESIKRGKYVQLDLTDKYAVQLIFKTSMNPRFNYIEFHSLGSYNYYFKKQYGQSNTTYDNSSFISDYLDLRTVYFEDLKYITAAEVNSNLSLFFVNKNFGSSNKTRTLLKYDSDMFDVVVFDNEWDDKVITDSDGNDITLKPPANIKPDGSVDGNKSIFDSLNVQDFLTNSFKNMGSLFDVIKLLGNFLNMLLISMPPLFQTVYAWAFFMGMAIVIVRLLR